MDLNLKPKPLSTSTGLSATLVESFLAVRRQTKALAAPLSAEDCAVQSMPDASPVKWHLAHTTWFFETFVLAPHLCGYTLFDPSFRVLFNSYYVGIGARHPRPERGMLTRPSLDQVLAYRAAVEEAMLVLLHGSGIDPDLAALIELGLHHEQQHQELILTDVKHMLSRNPLQPAYSRPWPLTPIRSGTRSWLSFDGGLCEIGRSPGEGFCFDNETPPHRVWLEPFRIASHPVSHGDFREFIEDGGYQRPELWLSAGWDMVTARGWEAPLYWQRGGPGEWRSFTLHGDVPVEPHAPVCHISFYEADAFARWAQARLPSEAEWEVAARSAPVTGNFLESGSLHPIAPRDEAPEGQLAQAFGDVWEWTRSDYAPYPGFRCAEGAVGEYNGKFMSGQYVLRGGSCATPASHVRASYRNFFPPDARWQFSGLRLARDAG